RGPVLDFLVRRVAISVVTLFVISLIVFTGVRMIPGDPARVMGGTDADAAGLAEIRQKYGLDAPIALGIAIPSGIFSAVRRNTVWDFLVNAVSLCGLSVPSFWLGLMLILLLSVRLHWLPASGFVPPWEDLGANLRRMLMPAFVLGNGLAAVLMRQTRNSMIEILSADYI